MEEKKERYSILDELTRSKGYEIALMTTFNFEVDYYERAILNRLLSCGIRKVSLFVDAAELRKALSVATISGIGRRYIVNPIDMRASFHPKVTLLIGNQSAKLFVSSANIKTSGYETNNEVFNYLEYDSDHREFAASIRDALEFFKKLNELSYGLDSGLIEEAGRMLHIRDDNNDVKVRFLHSINEPLLDQIQGLMGHTVKRINIAVPYYDNKLNALKELKDRFGEPYIQLYIQDETSTYPVRINEKEHIADHINVFDGFGDTPEKMGTNFYHGKVFAFLLNRECYMLYGSANCTSSALLKSYNQGGNVEAVLFEKCKIKEQDAFFDKIDVLDISEKELKSTPLVIEESKKTNYYFRFGEYDEQLELVIGYDKRKKNVRILISGTDCEYDDSLGRIVVHPSLDSISLPPSIFDIEISYDGGKEVLKGWYINRFEILHDRSRIAEKAIALSFDNTADDEKYRADRINLIRAFTIYLPGLSEQRKSLAAMEQMKNEREGEGAESEEESFILDIDIPDVYRTQYKQYSEVNRIQRILLHSFIGNDGLSMRHRLETEKERKVESDDHNVRIGKGIRRRAATSAEKKFGRFVKSGIRRIVNETEEGGIHAEQFLGVIVVVLDVFDKYTHRSDASDIFQVDYVIKERVNLMQMALDMILREKADVSVELVDAYNLHAIDIILDNHLLILDAIDVTEQPVYESSNKAFLVSLDKAFSIRHKLGSIVETMFEGQRAKGLTKRKNDYIKYLENLFGFKDDSQLIRFAKDKYGKKTTLQVEGYTAIVNVYTDKISDHWVPNIELIREINRYAHNVCPITTTKIIIQNMADNLSNPNPTVRIVHSIDMTYRKLSTMSTRKNGETRMEKTKSLYF